jgi:hypothetical protein
MKTIISYVLITTMTFSCAARRADLSNRVKSQQNRAFESLTQKEISELIVRANAPWEEVETKMAWLSLASNVIQHLDVARNLVMDDIKKFPSASGQAQANTGPSLNLSDFSMDMENRQMNLEERKINIDAAERSARSALDQQRMMMDYNRMSGDYAMKTSEFFKGMNQQEFDQGIKAATTRVQIEGERIKNLQALIEAKRKIIENNILSSYASAFNSYVRSFHEYATTMSSVMRGAKKVTHAATNLASSIMEYDRRVRRCASPITREQTRMIRQAESNLKISDYRTAHIMSEKNLSNRVRAISDLPSGRECLQLGLIQANEDEFPPSTPSDVYAVTNPILRLPVDLEPIGALAQRTVVGCAAFEEPSDTLSIVPHMPQVHSIAQKIEESATTLAQSNGSASTFFGEPSPGSRPTETLDPSALGTISDRLDNYETNTAYLTDSRRRDQREMLIPIPVTPMQATFATTRGNIEYKTMPNYKPYCTLRPAKPEGKLKMNQYVKAVRDYEREHSIQLKRDLELAGVRFDHNGRVQLNGAIFGVAGAGGTDTDMANLLVRRGLFYAEQCTKMTIAYTQQTMQAPGSNTMALPQPTEVMIGANKYGFFYPPYSLGDDTTTLQNDLTKATRACVDNALQTLAHSQQSLMAASEFYKFFGEAANIKAPAAPIPYIPNPPPGTPIYSR